MDLLGGWWELMVLKVFSKINDSVILKITDKCG